MRTLSTKGIIMNSNQKHALMIASAVSAAAYLSVKTVKSVTYSRNRKREVAANQARAAEMMQVLEECAAVLTEAFYEARFNEIISTEF